MTTELLTTLTNLANVLAWPALALLALIYFARPLRRFLDNASELSFRAGGVQATARRQMSVAANLGAASAKNGAVSDQDAAGIADAVGQALTPERLRRMAQASLLWVDDQPANNRFERRALAEAGIRVVTTTSTEEALDRLAGEAFDVIVTDMARPQDERAGYTLLAVLRDQALAPPLIIYSGSGGRPQHRRAAREAGAFGSTHDPGELLRLVVRAIGARGIEVDSYTSKRPWKFSVPRR